MNPSLVKIKVLLIIRKLLVALWFLTLYRQALEILFLIVEPESNFVCVQQLTIFIVVFYIALSITNCFVKKSWT